MDTWLCYLFMLAFVYEVNIIISCENIESQHIQN